MDNRKDLTKRLIADSFKALMCRCPFDKISIMMIATEADIRRPSFYNHFQDKYDLLEWIVAEDVIAPAGEALRRGSHREALQRLFFHLGEDAPFYRKAFSVTGQNGFEEAFVLRLTRLFASCITEDERLPPPLTGEDVAHYRAVCFVTFAKDWLTLGKDTDFQTLTEAYIYLLRHSFPD